MEKVFIILFFTALLPGLHAQDVNFAWAKQMGGTGSGGNGNSITTDASGNIYTTGDFHGTVDFDPGPGVFNLIAVGADIFVSKLNASGDFVWAKQMLGSGFTSTANSIAIDAQGNVYTTGRFYGTVDFDPGTGIFNLTPPTEDLFVSKLDASGNFIWAKQIGGAINNDAVGKSIAVDVAGNVYTTGAFHGSVDFDPGPGVYILNSSYNVGKIFVSKLNAAGNFVWAKQMVAIVDAASIFGSEAKSISVDVFGNVYTTGYFGGTVDFDPGPGVFYLSTVYGDNFISKLDATGNFIWARQVQQSSPSFVTGSSIKVDPSGNVYTTGYFGGTADFDPGPGVFNLTAGGTTDIFISKLDASGNFILAKHMGGPGSGHATSISLDAAGNIYTTGSFSRTADFDPGPAIYDLISIGINGDQFVSKLDRYGNFIWAKQMGGGSSSYAGGNSIAIDASGNIYTVGEFRASVDFDPGAGVFNLTSFDASDVFVHKMAQCTNSSSFAITATACKTYTLNGQTYNASGVYTQTLMNAAGCDSIISLNLTINIIKAEINVTACKDYIWNNHTYSTSGTYTDTLVSANGCDSVVTLNLNISSKLYSTIAQSICKGQDYSGYSTSGTYIDTLIAVNGCDSIRTLQLTVMPKPVPNLGPDYSLCAGDSLTLSPGLFTSYIWQNGSGQSHITVVQPGLYSVVVTDFCGSASDEIMITEKICDIYFPSAFTPNNDGKNDWFRISGGYNLKGYRLAVFNRWGQKVFSTFDYAKGWDGRFNGQFQPSSTFVWYCEFNKPGNDGKTKMKGTVTLIR